MSSSPDGPRPAHSDGPGIERSRAVDGVPAPTGPFSWAVRCGNLVYVSGLRGIEVETGSPAAGDERRLELIFTHLDRILARHGCAAGNVLATRVYVTDMARLRPLVNDAYEKFFGANLPTRTILEVSALNQGDSVEIEVVAALRPTHGPTHDAVDLGEPLFI